MGETTAPARKRRRLRRTLIAIGLLVPVSVLLMVLTLALPFTRNAMLREVLDQVRGGLPGDLSVERAEWPGLLRFEIGGVAWTVDESRLLQVDEIVLDVSPSAAWNRDLVVRELRARIHYADLAAIGEAFTDTTKTAPEEPKEPATVPYFRAGAFAGLPSLSLERVDVAADSLGLAPGQWALDLGLTADLDLLHAHRPVAHLDARGHDAGARWRLEELTLALDADARQAEGHLRASLQDVGVVELTLSPREEGGVAGALALEASSEPVLQFTARVIEEGSELVGLEIEGDLSVPGTDDLARIPSLTQAMATAPSLEGVRGRLEADVRTAPEPSVQLRLALIENAWLSSLVARATVREGNVDVEELDLHLPDLALQLSGRASPVLDLAATLEVSGGRWIEAFAPGTTLPDPLDVRLAARATGEAPDLEWDATLRAYLQEHGIAVAAGGRVTGERVDARVSPVTIRRGVEGAPGPMPAKANLVFDRATGGVTVEGLRVEGDYGRIVGRGTWTPERPSRVVLEADWPQPPPVLARALADTLRDRISARWPADPAPRLRVEAGLTPRGAVLDWTTTATLEAPGPATFAPMLGDGIRVDDLGPITCTLQARGSTDSLTTRLRASTDLSATAWIDSALVQVEGTPDSLEVSAGLRLLDALTFTTEGRLRGDALDFLTRVDLVADSLLARVHPPVKDTHVTLGGDITLAGTTSGLDLNGRLEGSASSPAADVPALVADVAYRPDRAALDVSLPEGVITPQVRLETVTLGAETSLGDEGHGPIDYRIAAHGPQIDLDHRGTLTIDESTRLASDRLDLSLQGQDLSLTRPLRLSFGGEPSVVSFEQVDLRGSLGTISATGSLGRDAADVNADVTLALPDKPAELALPDHLWPRSIELRLHATGPRSLTGSFGVGGIAPDGENPVRLTADASLDSALVVKLLVEDEANQYVDGNARLAFDWDRLAEGGDPVAGAMQIELSTQNLPLPATWLGEKEPRMARLDATLSAQGTLARPRARTQVQVSFPGWPRVGNWTARFESDLTSEPQPELDAKWYLARAGANLLTGDAKIPLRLRPPGLDGERSVRVTTESTTLPLRDVDELLPADIGMDGSVEIDFLAEGPPDDPDLRGRISLKEARAKLADGSSVTANGRVDLGGRARLPELRGSLRIQQGVLVIPDTPPSLLPAEGTSLLWQAATSQDTVRIDATVPAAGTPVPVDLDMTVDIPSGLWVRGKGLEMEVAGTLRMKRAPADSLPTITGELSAVRGRFAFLGHDFTLERGSVSFFGSALTPELDARLGTEVGSTTVRVIVTGNASKPQLKLESQPEMTEGDITSLLLFGRPLDELDDDQLGLVRNRTNDVAKSFGIAALQGQVRQRLGVDLLQIDTGTSNEPGSVLVGKYLAPNILLKYEQMLQETTAFLVNLEYLLTRRVRVETSYGRRMPSGVGVNWTKDY